MADRCAGDTDVAVALLESQGSAEPLHFLGSRIMGSGWGAGGGTAPVHSYTKGTASGVLPGPQGLGVICLVLEGRRGKMSSKCRADEGGQVWEEEEGVVPEGHREPTPDSVATLCS